MRNTFCSFYVKIFLLFLVTITACRKDEALFTSKPTELYSAKVANDWADMMRTLTKKTAGFTPPVASRAFGYMGVTLYETVVPGMPNYQSLTGQLTDMPQLASPDLSQEYNWAIAVNSALAYIAKNFYPTMPTEQSLAVIKLEDDTYENLKTGVALDVAERSKAWGLSVAQKVFEWSKNDGGHEGYGKNFPTTFTPPTGDGLWVSTFPKFQKALQPYWGNNRTFIPKCAESTQPTPPKTYSDLPTSPFNVAALEVYTTVKNASPEQIAIAKYWSDDPGVPGTPPGHLLSVATQVLQKENWNLAKSAEVYAKVGMALADGFVSCWRCKYQHNYLRPITYIRSKFEADWTSILETPAFPEFTSGHSVASGATARVLSDLFGYTYTFSDHTHEQRTDINGKPRSFASFNDMAAEAAISRLYGGIHYREAIEKGVIQGIQVGFEVGKLKFRKS
jgi:PAP2 superfamily